MKKALLWDTTAGLFCACEDMDQGRDLPEREVPRRNWNE